MNGQEQSTLNELNKKFDAHIKDVTPIMKAWHDRQITDKFVDSISSKIVSVLKLIALIIGILISLKIISGFK